MTTQKDIPALIEGRLNAHRRVLAVLVAAVLDGDGSSRRRLADLLERDPAAADQSEDLGAVPDAVFAIRSTFAEELGRIAKEVAELRAARAGDAPGSEEGDGRSDM